MGENYLPRSENGNYEISDGHEAFEKVGDIEKF